MIFQKFFKERNNKHKENKLLKGDKIKVKFKYKMSRIRIMKKQTNKQKFGTSRETNLGRFGPGSFWLGRFVLGHFGQFLGWVVLA